MKSGELECADDEEETGKSEGRKSEEEKWIPERCKHMRCCTFQVGRAEFEVDCRC